MKRKKTFREKLADDKDFPRVQPLTGGMAKRFGEGTILLPSAREVDDLMRRAKKGKLITINQIREHLAARHDADMACPIVTGIHARIAAGAAGEDEADGRKRVTPYWRTLKSGGELNEKYPKAVALTVLDHSVMHVHPDGSNSSIVTMASSSPAKDSR